MIRWGIIGCGDVTEVKSGPGFQNANGSALVAVMRRNAEKAADYARRHNVPRWYSNADQLLADPEVDAVSIATPPSSHRELAIKACQARKPTIVEKPMARNHAECLEMIENFSAHNVPLFVAYYRRALPRFLTIKSLIDNGTIGQPLAVSVTMRCRPGPIDPHNLPWRLQPKMAGGGIFVDLGSHTLDLLDFLFGPISRVRGFADNQGGPYPVEDAVVMSFIHENGVQGTGTWHFKAHQDLDRVEIQGTQGLITFPTFGNNPVKLETAQTTEMLDLPNPQTIQQPFIQTVVDELQSQGQCPATGVSAARTTWVMEQVLNDYYHTSPK